MVNTFTREQQPSGGSVCQRYFSEAELSQYSGLSVRTLQGWRLRGQGPPFRKLRGSVRYDIQEFDAWVQSCPGGGEQLT